MKLIKFTLLSSSIILLGSLIIAEDKLIEAIKFHDDNLELYDYQVDRILNRFSPNNEKTISTYKKLINNLFMEV